MSLFNEFTQKERYAFEYYLYAVGGFSFDEIRKNLIKNNDKNICDIDIMWKNIPVEVQELTAYSFLADDRICIDYYSVCYPKEGFRNRYYKKDEDAHLAKVDKKGKFYTLPDNAVYFLYYNNKDNSEKFKQHIDFETKVNFIIEKKNFPIGLKSDIYSKLRRIYAYGKVLGFWNEYDINKLGVNKNNIQEKKEQLLNFFFEHLFYFPSNLNFYLIKPDKLRFYYQKIRKNNYPVTFNCKVRNGVPDEYYSAFLFMDIPDLYKYDMLYDVNIFK